MDLRAIVRDDSLRGFTRSAIEELREGQTHQYSKVLFEELKPGQYTPIIPVLNPTNHQPYAYMIVKLMNKEPAGQRDLNDPRVQQAIRQQLRDGRSQLLKNAFFEMLRDQAKVENFLAEEIFKNSAH